VRLKPKTWRIKVWLPRANEQLAHRPQQLAKSPDYYTLTNRWGGKFDMTYCNIGVLSVPFMRAAPGRRDRSRPGHRHQRAIRHRVRRLQTRPPRPPVPPRMSAIWIVPTRHPQALEEALMRYR
jgi:hypothetical protein